MLALFIIFIYHGNLVIYKKPNLFEYYLEYYLGHIKQINHINFVRNIY